MPDGSHHVALLYQRWDGEMCRSTIMVREGSDINEVKKAFAALFESVDRNAAQAYEEHSR